MYQSQFSQHVHQGVAPQSQPVGGRRSYQDLYRGIQESSPEIHRVHQTCNAFDPSFRSIVPRESQMDRQAQASNDLAGFSVPAGSMKCSNNVTLQASSLPRKHLHGSDISASHISLRSHPPCAMYEQQSSPRTPSSIFPTFSCRPGSFESSSNAALFQLPSSPAEKVSMRRNIQNRNRSGKFSTLKQQVSQPAIDLPLSKVAKTQFSFPHQTPTVQGIQLISLNELPDRFRSIFPFPLFNAVQSKCFETIYKSNSNLVLSAPTGSGKTAVMEMAICRQVGIPSSAQNKIIYMAPTKSLCSERYRDWQSKFSSLGLQCAELTSDTDQWQLRNVQNASIIITTPEKWDSITRKWKDHAKLLQLVSLFLIDEVHILKDTRGATLEAVVSRMKSVDAGVRFVALSATVPNSEDIATWLGKDPSNQLLPARDERFGEEFRPVKLQKHVYGLSYKGNDFGFETICDQKIPEVVAKHSHKKPIMVFCITRKSASKTSKLLSDLWLSQGPRNRPWSAPAKRITVDDPELKETVANGVAYHHAGLGIGDRNAVEKGYLSGDISVICCTSTLAVGVNLPCHLVIIKNTMSYQDEGLKEYADLELMQMLGRAGRPQFDDSAVAVILTKQEKVSKYEKMVSGQERLESCLHLNLIDHLNAEIGLGTICDLGTARRWLASTFLCVRLLKNPDHYKLDDNVRGRNLDDRVQQICERDISLLKMAKLVHAEGMLKCTEYGDAMARYYVKFETMVQLLNIPPRAKISEILSALCHAAEFHEVRFRSAERQLFRTINTSSGMRFPINVDISSAPQKRSIILQSELGGIDFPTDEKLLPFRKQFLTDKAIIFTHVHRLIRCVIDCQIHAQDAPATRHALELARSMAARVWDNSPLQMKQIPSIGIVAVRKFVMAGINSLEALEATNAQRLDTIMSKNPGFGLNIVSFLKNFPKLRVSVKSMGKDTKPGLPIKLKFKAELGFLNEKIPVFFNKKPVFLCLMAERSDGFLIDFRRVNSKRVGNGLDVLLCVDLHNEKQYITCYVMCDEIAGTMQYAELHPKLPASMFRTRSEYVFDPQDENQTMNISRRRTKSETDRRDIAEVDCVGDEFGDDDLDDGTMLAVANGIDISNIDDLGPSKLNNPRPIAPARAQPMATDLQDQELVQWGPTRLQNGKWACKHRCKDKSACKHFCCREGLDKVPKIPKIATKITHTTAGAPKYAGVNKVASQGTLPFKTPSKHTVNSASHGLGTVNVTSVKKKPNPVNVDSQGRDFPQHTRKSVFTDGIGGTRSTHEHVKASGNRQRMQGGITRVNSSSSYGSDWMDDLPSPSALLTNKPATTNALVTRLEPKPSTMEHCSFEHSDTWIEKEHTFAEDSFDIFDHFDDLPRPGAKTSTTLNHHEEPPAKAEQGVKPLDVLSSPADSRNLFLHTSSPERLLEIAAEAQIRQQGKKRQRSVTQSASDFELGCEVLPVKRQTKEQTSTVEQPVQLSQSSTKSSLTRPTKGNLYASTDITGVDVDFFAEFEDFVEFV